jgi:hypothetical protein
MAMRLQSPRAMRTYLPSLLLVAACGSSVDTPPDAGPPVANGVFTDHFAWSGAHAAVVGDGTAVFWNQDAWDVTGDTHAIAIMGEWSDAPSGDTNSGHAVYVHKATASCGLDDADTAPCTPEPDDTSMIAGGDGSPGVAIIHLDEQDIVGGRLRNPMVITADQPGVIRLRAPRFVTDGAWWELALTPASRVIGSENTVVESQGEGDGLGDPGGEPNQPGKGAGPGHDPQEESFNLVVTGSTDFACDNFTAEEGSLTRIAIKTLIDGSTRPGGYPTSQGLRYNAYNPKSLFSGQYYGNYQQNLIRPGLDGRKPLPADFLDADGNEIAAKVDAANLADADTLYLWQFTFTPDGVDVSADLGDGDGLQHLEHFDLGVPWNEVYVDLMAVAYQDDHHPQRQPCYAPDPYTKRQLRFGGIQVSPVEYTSVAVFPPDRAPLDDQGNVMLCNGGSCGRWMRYDMRDTHDFGAPDTIDGVAQPRANPAPFAFARDYAHGSTAKFPGGLAPEPGFDLYVPVDDDVRAATKAQLVYNVLGAHGKATLSVNGHEVGALLNADSVPGALVRNDIDTEPGCTDYDCMSVRRSIAIAPSLLTDGAQDGLAHLHVDFDQAQLGSGTFLDRLQLEVMH